MFRLIARTKRNVSLEWIRTKASQRSENNFWRLWSVASAENGVNCVTTTTTTITTTTTTFDRRRHNFSTKASPVVNLFYCQPGADVWTRWEIENKLSLRFLHPIKSWNHFWPLLASGSFCLHLWLLLTLSKLYPWVPGLNQWTFCHADHKAHIDFTSPMASTVMVESVALLKSSHQSQKRVSNIS